MNERIATLVRLSVAGLTVADPSQDPRGREVRDRDGEVVGKVDDLLVDGDERRARFLRVTRGGMLGFGATPSFVPVEAIDRVEEEVVHLDRDRGAVRGATRYDPELVEDSDYGRVHGYHGHVPPWVPAGPWGTGRPSPLRTNRGRPQAAMPAGDEHSDDVEGRPPASPGG